MKTSLIKILACLCLILSNLNAQEISFNYPRDTSKYLGNVKDVFFYESQAKVDINRINNTLIEDITPSYSYHFDENKLMTHMVVYQGHLISTITSYIYNQDKNLMYKIHERAVNIEVPENKDSLINIIMAKSLDSLYYTTFTKFEDDNSLSIRSTEGAEILAYLYDMQNLQLFITGSLREPSIRLKFDQKSRVIEYQYYSLRKGEIKPGMHRWIYDGDLLIEKHIITSQTSTIKTYTYDDDLKLSSENISCIDSIRNQKIEYNYIGEDITEKGVFDNKGRLIFFTTEVRSMYSTTSKTLKYEKDGSVSPSPYIDTFTFTDEIGNVIKRFKINHEGNTMLIHEYHFDYY